MPYTPGQVRSDRFLTDFHSLDRAVRLMLDLYYLEDSIALFPQRLVELDKSHLIPRW